MTRADGGVISVIIPTHRRPEMLGKAVNSVTRQQLPRGWELEVIVSVSDPEVRTDVDAANRLAAVDRRIKVAVGPGRGAGATRNAGIATARGSILAFIDDDCEAQPGWLTAGLAALATADIIQGTTRPAADVPRYHHTMSVTPPSWLWETCNLMVRKEFVEAVGGFNESWNGAGRAGNLFQFGEDAEIGWQIIRAGARSGSAPNAVVNHAVFPRTYLGYLGYMAGIRRFPHLFRTTPEVRRIFYRGYFVNRRHLLLTGCAVLMVASVSALATRNLAPAATLAAAGLVAYVWPLRGYVRRGDLAGGLRELAERVPLEIVEFGCALYGSIRWRRLLL